MLSEARAIVDLLGGRKVFKKPVSSTKELIRVVRSGLPYRALENVTERVRLSKEEVIVSLALPERTLARRKKENRLLPEESDRLLRLARIVALAKTVFGDEAMAVNWLHKLNRALGRATPLSLLDTDIGAQQVEDELARIEYGIIA